MREKRMLTIFAVVNFLLFSAHFSTSLILAFSQADKTRGMRSEARVRYGFPLLKFATPSSEDYVLAQNETEGVCEGTVEALGKKYNGISFLQPAVTSVLQVDFYGCLQFFNLTTAFFHLTYAILSSNTCGSEEISRRLYPRKFLDTGINTLRWLEYALTAPPMMLVIFQLFGMLSQVQAFTTLFLTSAVMVLGGVFPDILVDLEPQKKRREEEESKENNDALLKTDPAFSPLAKDLLFLSSFAYVILWIPPVLSFASLFRRNDDVPSFLVWIFITQIVLFSSFAVVRFVHFSRVWSLRQKKIGPRQSSSSADLQRYTLQKKEYFYIELAYLLLSVSSKLLLTFLAEQNVKNKPYLYWQESCEF